MNKSRHKEESSLQAADHLPKKSGAENILVFLVLAILLLAASVYSTQRQLQLKNTPASRATYAGRYVWLTSSPGYTDGLYLFTPHQLEEHFSGPGSLLAGGSALETDPIVAAIQYDGAIPRQASLPPALANIFFQPIPINRADADILTSLPGIGPVLAERIVQRREKHGPFRSKDELLHIAGIGHKKFGALVERISLD
jgi:competence ComEA-like helix-hairpin-helix protein